MADFNKTIRLVIDTVTGNASSGLRSLKSELDGTEGSWNKMKVAGSSAFSFIEQNAGAFALSAGAALIGFGVKAVGSFEDVALTAGKLSDALGISTQDASKLEETAKDLGIGVDALEAGLGRMNKTAGATPDKFAAIGAEIARNKDGTIDVVRTFENVSTALDNIPDAGKRAKAAADIFGRGWQSMAELIRQGGDGIKATLDSVESAKVFSPEQVATARKFRDQLDQLRGVAESVALVVGDRVATAITDLIDVFDKGKRKVQEFANYIADHVPEAVKKAVKGANDAAAEGGPQTPKLLDNIVNAFEMQAHNIAQAGRDAGTIANSAYHQLNDIIHNRNEEVTASLGDLGAGTVDVSKRFQDLMWSTNQLTGASGMKPLIAALLDAGAAGRVAAGQTDDVATTFKDMDSAADKAAHSADDLSKALSGVFGSATDVQGASDAVRDNVDKLTQSFKDNGRTLDENTAKGRDNRNAVRDSATGIQDLTEKMLANGSSITDVNGTYQLLRAQLVNQMLPAFKGNRDAAEAYVNQLGLTPDSVTTAVQLQGDQDAKARVQAVLTSLGTIPHEWATAIQASIDRGDYNLAEQQLAQLARNRIATIQVQTSGGAPIQASGSGFSTYRAIAGGGDVAAGEAVVVGDRFGVNSPSAEVFVPKVAGTVYNQDQIAAAAGRRGGDTYIFNVAESDPAKIAAAVAVVQWRQNAQPRRKAS